MPNLIMLALFAVTDTRWCKERHAGCPTSTVALRRRDPFHGTLPILWRAAGDRPIQLDLSARNWIRRCRVLFCRQYPRLLFVACRFALQLLSQLDQAWCNRIAQYHACLAARLSGKMSIAQ